MARSVGRRCIWRECLDEVSLGTWRYRVETTARLVSPEEAAGRPGRVGAARAGSALLNAMLRANGWTTTDYLVGIGTRVATTRIDLDWRLTCDVAWIEEVERSREGGVEAAAQKRAVEGMSCRADERADGAATGAISPWTARFRFHYGLPTAPDSIGAALDSLGQRWATDTLVLFPMRLEKVGGSAYQVSARLGERKLGVVHLARWDVHRNDGVLVARIHRRFVDGVAALDLTAAANEEETAALRLFLSAFAVRLDAP